MSNNVAVVTAFPSAFRHGIVAIKVTPGNRGITAETVNKDDRIIRIIPAEFG